MHFFLRVLGCSKQIFKDSVRLIAHFYGQPVVCGQTAACCVDGLLCAVWIDCCVLCGWTAVCCVDALLCRWTAVLCVDGLLCAV